MPPKRKASQMEESSEAAVAGGKSNKESSSFTPAPPPITVETLQYRLDTGNILKQGGQRASLTKCAQKLGAIVVEGGNGDDKGDTTTASPTNSADDKTSLLQELRLFELETTKLVLQQQQRERQVAVNETLSQDLSEEIETMEAKVATSSQQARQALQRQTVRQEYETLAKQILLNTTATNSSSSYSQQALHDKIDQVKQQSTLLEEQAASVKESSSVKAAQFQLLVEYVNDLKRSLKEDDSAVAAGKKKGDSGDDGGGGGGGYDMDI
ncbi:MAG: hypothetical protein SGARI_008199 [Bacillariaceae sp.]